MYRKNQSNVGGGTVVKDILEMIIEIGRWIEWNIKIAPGLVLSQVFCLLERGTINNSGPNIYWRYNLGESTD